jgi:hypothetical protein
VSIDKRLANLRGSGVYVFKAHGHLYHKLDPLKLSGEGPQHMQLYFYDTDDGVVDCLNRSPGLDENLIRLARGILKRLNPYVQVFTSLGNVQNFVEYTMELITSIDVDQRRYNAPAMDQIAAIWLDGNHKKYLTIALLYMVNQ